MFSMDDGPDMNPDAFSFDWTDMYHWPVDGVGLQDAFHVDMSSLAASNPGTHRSPPEMRNSSCGTGTGTGTANAAPQPAKEIDAFRTFKSLTDIVFSRPSSPDAIQAKDRWFSGPDKADGNTALMNDQNILNNFLWLFHDHVAGWFSLFRNQTVQITRSTRKEWYLLMASVGGLFSHQRGANRLARSLYHIGRQHLLSFVSYDLPK